MHDITLSGGAGLRERTPTRLIEGSLQALRLGRSVQRSDGLALEPPAGCLQPGFRTTCQPVGSLPWRGSKEARRPAGPGIRHARHGHTCVKGEGPFMAAVMIGVDPHKGSHTAVAIGGAEEPLGELRVRACAAQAERLLSWAADWPERTWAVEGAAGLGHLLAQQLLAAGERVLDVQPKLGARVRLLATGAVNKNDPNDARSVAVAALRSPARRRSGPTITRRC